MEDLINEIIKAVSPRVVEIIAVIIGVIVAKLGGIWRAWKLGKRIKVGADAVQAEVDRLHLEGFIDEALHAVLVSALGSFARNAAQISAEAADGLAQFGQDLQSPPQPAK